MIPSQKKIAILHPEVYTKGGAVSMMLYLATILAKNGNEVVFFTTKYERDKFETIENITFFVGNKVKILFQLKNFDYMFIGNSPMHFVGVASKIFYFSPVKIFWWHHHYPWYYNKNANFYVFLKKLLERFCLLFIDELLVNSQYLQKTIQQVYKKKSKILYPVVDKIFLNTNKNKIQTKTTTLFTYSRWVEGKNLKQIFHTYDFIKQKLPKLEVYIAGVGDELTPFIEKYKADTSVHFLGLLGKQELAYYLQKARVFLFPSQIDSFGMSAAESIYSGVPVIGFIGKGLSEIVQNNKNGCTVESQEDFTNNTFCLLTDDEQYNQMVDFINKDNFKFSEIYFEKNLEKIF